MGRGALFGRLTVSKVPGTDDEFTTRAVYRFAAGGAPVVREGKSVVYTGHQWRGRSASTAAVPDSAWREVMSVEPGWQEMSGRWFRGGYDEFGIDITAQRVFETIAEEGYAGGYTAIKDHVREVRPRPVVTPSLPTPTHGPGEMAESDWSPYDIRFTTGKRAIIQAFSYTLVVSTRKHVELYTSNDLFALMDGHEKAFARFEGCAHQCKYDSQKPVVLRWEGDQPIYNPRFLAFASHYEFRPVAVRRRKPNDKPRVERGFWEVERSFLNGREFRDIDDMRMQLADWLVRIVDHRKRHGSTAIERFEKERAALVPLPRHPYDTARVIYRVCSIDGFVVWEGNAYAVPYEHVTDILPVRVTQRLAPAWSTDWITPEGRRKLRDYGIAPPGPAGVQAVHLVARGVECPRCGSARSERLSAFGSTACKALYRCLACREPFELFKAI